MATSRRFPISKGAPAKCFSYHNYCMHVCEENAGKMREMSSQRIWKWEAKSNKNGRYQNRILDV
jgi:hypothetical protein